MNARSGEQVTPSPEDFAAAWASKCEELSRETSKVTALIGILRGVVEASRPGTSREQLDLAWKRVAAVTLLDDRRVVHDFMDRLAEVNARHSGRGVRVENEAGDDQQ